MDDIERGEVAALRERVESIIARARGGTWSDRISAVCAGLADANLTWWRRHAADRTAYERDLTRLNSATGWKNEHEQLAYWTSDPPTSPRLMPPKFFGGDPTSLDPRFVASMSLNHAVPNHHSELFATELDDQQTPADAFASHQGYFRRGYAYRPFFKPRGVVLQAYARAIGARPVPDIADWAHLNQQWAFYIEAFPTRSRRFIQPPLQPRAELLSAEVFVCAINTIVHVLVLSLLQPAAVMLVGRATWNRWPDTGLSVLGRDVSHLIRRGGRKCGVLAAEARSSLYDVTVRVVRANFLRNPFGPNSNQELERLGAAVLADTDLALPNSDVAADKALSRCAPSGPCS